MFVKRIIGVFVLLLVIGYRAEGVVTLPQPLDQIQKELSAMTSFSYDYIVKQSYPDGTTNVLKGRVNTSKDYFEESNAQYFILQNRSWYYKADHSSKTIYIIDLEHVRAAAKKKLPARRMNIIPDSILAKYGKINTSVKGDLARVDISFGDDVLLKKLYLEYDLKEKLPKVYRIESDVMYEIDKETFDEKYARQVLTMTNFEHKSVMGTMNMNDYFSYKNGKIVLKKYTSYKLIQHI